MYGITYIVRPAMQPSDSLVMSFLALDGSIQLLFGPEASLVGWQTKVRCSTRATSVGEER